MIDINEPLELEDGTPVTASATSRQTFVINVRLPPGKSCRRDGVVNRDYPAGNTWAYNRETGRWLGDVRGEMFRIQNRNNPADFEFDV